MKPQRTDPVKTPDSTDTRDSRAPSGTPAVREHRGASESDLETIASREYKYGFVTDIEADSIPAGLSEDVIRLISAKKGEPEWLLEWRLKAYRHWLTMTEPEWANVTYPPVDYQDIVYYSAPKIV